ncbi:MAG: diguanylate cyclase [Lachnospiraceae bacterium]|nr:diguanylate cyclase [Lachnospiraceae bacterium]
METIGALFCLMIMFYMAVNKLTEKIKYLLVMYGICAALFVMDACAYIFRGNTDALSLFMTRFCNNGVFLLNVLLSVIFLHYVKDIIRSYGIAIPGMPYKISLCFYLLTGVCVVINFFNRWMFGFDESNYYHRNTGWYVYSLLFVLGTAALMYILFSIRTQLDAGLFISLILYVLVPFVAIIFQMFIYGISISNIGLAATLTLLFFFYLRRQEKAKKKLKISSILERNMISTILMFTLMIICMSTSIITCIAHMQKIAHENSIKDRQNVAQLVRSDIENSFLAFLTASQMITGDCRVIELLQQTSRETAADDEEYMSRYLSCIKEEFGYQMVFVVSEKSGAYYTYDGISKYIDVVNDPHDIWYRNFKDSSKDYLLDVDTDEANGGKLTVFVNRAIYDQKGTFLGVGGVGVDIAELQKMIADYELAYNLRINLINYDGLVQINSDSIHIEKDYLDNSYLSELTGEEFLYDEQPDFCRMSCYMESLDWYLIIDDYQPDKISVQRIVFPSMGIFIIGILAMGVVFSMITRREYINSEKLLEKTIISLTDELTGLNNRRAYVESLAEIDENELHDSIVLVMMDVNGLKVINDSIGHDAGDELLIGAAECIREAFGHLGDVFRIGGDEFTAILNCSKDEAKAAADILDITAGSWKGKMVDGISISKGIVYGYEHPEMTLNEIEDLADKLMYEDKAVYYRNK